MRSDLPSSDLSDDEADRSVALIDCFPAILFEAAWEPGLPLCYVNAEVEAVLGYSAIELLADPSLWSRLIHADDRERVLPSAGASLPLDRDDLFRGRFRMLTREARELAMHGTFTAKRDSEGVIIGLYGIIVEVGSERSWPADGGDIDLHADELEPAFRDDLTNLPNRSFLERQIAIALRQALSQGREVSLLALDIDGFKLVNDSLGHGGGDELLCDIARRLAASLPADQLLVRLGADEFMLLLVDLDHQTALDRAESVAEQLLAVLDRSFMVRGLEIHIGASIGISIFPRDAIDGDQLLRHADAAMYEAKGHGRNASCLYRGTPGEPLERLTMTSRMHKALNDDEFVLYWQPIVDPADGTIRRLEALIRWRDPQRGLIGPTAFISLAEETGFIDRVGDWVIAAACKQLEQWQQCGFELLPVAVNVSPHQLLRPGFGARLWHSVNSSEAARNLSVEITETVAMADPARTTPVLNALADRGVQIAVDDFGLGYSSLARLLEIPARQLKIDRSFLKNVPQDREAAAIVKAMVELAAALGLDAVAEGIETEQQRQFIVDHHCPLAQGFLFGRPMVAAELEQRLRPVGR